MKTVSVKNIKQVLKTQLQPYWANADPAEGIPFRRVLDNESYLVPTIQEMMSVIQQNNVSLPPLGEGYDCEDYAFAFKGSISLYVRKVLQSQHGLCVGIAGGLFNWTPGFHACNWFINDQGIIFWIEPQNNLIHSLNECRPVSIQFLIV